MEEAEDVYGKALKDFFNGNASPLLIETSYGETEEMPIEVFFRKPKDFPEMEAYALKLCEGEILDIGAGAGSHALYLQAKKKDVTALEISETAIEIMKSRGVKKTLQADIFHFSEKRFDTLLLLMNGIGIAGTVEGLNQFLQAFKQLLKPLGKIIFDSSDITYLYEEHPMPEGKYFGEISYRYLYEGKKGQWFNWLYIHQQKMLEIADANGYILHILAEDDSGQYLGTLQLKEEWIGKEDLERL
jgi:2-polyprenyl-3-methyl-5-hydroxy-6-metoxy-1,4-benzoquinol methylase